MNCVIERQGGRLCIQIEGTAGAERELLAAFAACREGRCKCPASLLGKVQAMDMRATAETIHIELIAQPGADINPHALEQCLSYAIAAANEPS